MKKLYVILLFLVSGVPANAQKGKEYFLIDSINYEALAPGDKALIDSLLPLYHKALNDTMRIQCLDGLASNMNDDELWAQYNQRLYEKSLAMLRDSVRLGKEELIATKNYFANSLENLGYLQNLRGEKAKALEYYEQGLRLYEKTGNKNGMSQTYNNMAIVFNEEGNITKALDYQLRALKINEEVKDKSLIANSYNNLARFTMDQGDTAKALTYLNKGIVILEEIGYTRGLAYSLANIGVIHRNQKNYSKALEYFRKSIPCWEKTGDKHGFAMAWLNMGITYQREADEIASMKDSALILAMNYISRGLKMFEETGDREGISRSCTGLARVCYSMNKIPAAKEYGERALQLAKEIGFPSAIKDAADILYKIYRAENKWKDALVMLELHTQMKDSIFNADTKKSLLQKQMKYEYEKQQVIKDAEHQKEIAVVEEEKKRQQVISYAVGLGLLMVLVFSGLIFNRLKVTRKQKGIIEEQKQIVDEKNKHITASINYAKRIQDSILPSSDELKKHFPQHFVLFQPREIVSGDFYWIARQNDKAILAVADCTGHGVPGAFMSMIGNTLLNEIVNEQKIIQPADILNQLNVGIVQALHQESRSQDDGMDISVLFLDHATNSLTFAGANHSLAIIDGHTLTKVEGDPFSIGSVLGKRSVSFSQHQIPLKKDTCVFLSTDGYADQPGGEKGKKFMSRKLEQLLVSISEKDTAEQKNILARTFDEWKNKKEQLDDVLVFGIKIT